LPAQSTKPLRVCDRCYDSSTTRSTDPNPNWQTQTKPASDSSGDEDSDDENQNGPVEITGTWWQHNASATSANLGVSNEESLTPFSQLGPPPRQTNE